MSKSSSLQAGGTCNGGCVNTGFLAGGRGPSSPELGLLVAMLPHGSIQEKSVNCSWPRSPNLDSAHFQNEPQVINMASGGVKKVNNYFLLFDSKKFKNNCIFYFSQRVWLDML